MTSSSVQVAVRLRPINQKEKNHGTLPVVTASTAEKTVTVIKGKGSRQSRSQFSFDNVFTSFSTQEEVFEATLEPVIDDVFKGFESTVFAYGQTGTGKTHTMEGNLKNSDDYGIIPRSAIKIFEDLRQPQYSNHTIFVSYLEIYNEDLCDLLSDGMNKVIMMEGGNGTVCRGLSEEKVGSAHEVIQLMHKAQNRRRIGETKMNDKSSRSHCIFTIRVNASVQIPSGGGNLALEGKLHLVDLAGSECAKSASLTTGNEAARERERMSINRSLLTLGRVISALKERNENKKLAKSVRIPYRDSKLTRILQESLGGRCKTVIIATLSPSITAIEESMSTLNYAQSATGIINKPISTSFMAASAGNLASNNATPSKGSAMSVDSWHEMEVRLEYMQGQVEEAQAALARKHLQQEDLLERAKVSEVRVLDLETASNLLQSELRNTQGKLSSEIKTRRLAESNLRAAEYSLEKCHTILRATQKTEQNLNLEAKALLQSLKESIDDGDNLHNAIVECKKTEMQRKDATLTFSAAAVGVLHDTARDLGRLSKNIDSHAKTLIKAANSGYEQENLSLLSCEDLIKGISTNVETVTDAINAQIVGEGGFMTLLHDAKSSIKVGSSSANKAIHDGETVVKATCNLVQENLARHANTVKELEASYASITNKTADNLATSVAESKAKLEGMVRDMSFALESAKDRRNQTRSTLSDIIMNWKRSSLEASTSIESAAKAQSKVLEEAVGFVDKEMAHHDAADEILSAQKTFVGSKSAACDENLAAQATLLSHQQQMIIEARDRHDEIRAESIKCIMKGIQDLVSKQVDRLAASDKKYMDAMINSNECVTRSNFEIANDSSEIAKRIDRDNIDLSTETSKMRATDIHLKEVTTETAFVLNKLSEASLKSSDTIASISKEAKENITFLQNEEQKTDEIFKSVNLEVLSCAKHIEDSVHQQTKQNLVQLSGASQDIATFSTNIIIAEASDAIGVLEDSRKETIKTFDSAMTGLYKSTSSSIEQLELVSTKQKIAATELCAGIGAMETEFCNSISSDAKANMQSRKNKLKQIATDHTTGGKGQILSIQTKSTNIIDQITEFATYPEVEPAPGRMKHTYNSKLSSTPAESDIIRSFNLHLPPSAPCDTEEEDEKTPNCDSSKSQEPFPQDSISSQNTSRVESKSLASNSATVRAQSLSPSAPERGASVGKSSKQSVTCQPLGKRTNLRSRNASSVPAPRKKAKIVRNGFVSRKVT